MSNIGKHVIPNIVEHLKVIADLSKYLKHPNILGAGARKRMSLPCDLKFGVVMEEFYRGTLHSGSGDIVKNIKQARAIGFSETRRCKKRKRR